MLLCGVERLGDVLVNVVEICRKRWASQYVMLMCTSLDLNEPHVQQGGEER